jgi:hypothetical protein
VGAASGRYACGDLAPILARAPSELIVRLGGVALSRGVALNQSSWVSKCWTLLGIGARGRLSGQMLTRIRAVASISHLLIKPFGINFKNFTFINSFTRPSVTGRAFFRLYAKGLAAPLHEQQILDATL